VTQTTDPLGQHWGFTGRFQDEESGLWCYRARYYDSERGRFMQRDPLGYAQAPSLYAYAGSAPLSYIDPSGLAFNDAWANDEVDRENPYNDDGTLKEEHGYLGRKAAFYARNKNNWAYWLCISHMWAEADLLWDEANNTAFEERKKAQNAMEEYKAAEHAVPPLVPSVGKKGKIKSPVGGVKKVVKDVIDSVDDVIDKGKMQAEMQNAAASADRAAEERSQFRDALRSWVFDMEKYCQDRHPPAPPPFPHGRPRGPRSGQGGENNMAYVPAFDFPEPTRPPAPEFGFTPRPRKHRLRDLED